MPSFTMSVVAFPFILVPLNRISPEVIGVNPDKVVETLLSAKEIEDELRGVVEKNNKDYAKIAKELGITEINSKYLIKKLSAA